jgi:hypothetical protein
MLLEGIVRCLLAQRWPGQTGNPEARTIAHMRKGNSSSHAKEEEKSSPDCTFERCVEAQIARSKIQSTDEPNHSTVVIKSRSGTPHCRVATQ